MQYPLIGQESNVPTVQYVNEGGGFNYHFH